jgi:signal transduction histidine kinase
MNISSKLIFLLTISVGTVMLLISILSLIQRESGLENALRDELKAHAITLQTALEENYLQGRKEESQRLIDKLRKNTKVYSVTLLDKNGRIIKSSHPDTKKVFVRPHNLNEVFEIDNTIEFNYETEGRRFISIALPLQIDENTKSALTIVKPLDLIEKEIYNARINWMAVTLFLLAIILLVVTLVLKHSFSKPIYELLIGAENFGKGNLNYRVKVNKNGDELAILADNFNKMADNLAEQREMAKKESEGRLLLERELRHSERLASVGRLAAGVAHELGTPLNVIDARAAQILRKSDMTQEKKERNLKIIRRQADRITHLVRQLLNLARPFNLKFAEIDLSKHLQETIEQTLLEEDKIEVDFQSEKNFKVLADRDYIRQVWINIIQNARQAILKSNNKVKKIIITVNKEKKDGQKFVAVRFSDSGEGIKSEHLDKIFDPFYTTKDIGQGTGLGLAVAHRIIEEHHGVIEAENSHNQGAVFTILLPAGEEFIK